MNNYQAKVGDILRVISVEDDREAEYVGKKGEVTEVHLFDQVGNVYELRMEDGVRVEFYDYEVEYAEEPEQDADFYGLLKESLEEAVGEIPSTSHEVQSYEPNFDWGAGDREWEEMEAVGREIIYDVYNTDSVEHPSHYTQGKFETIEIIEEITGGYEDGFVSYCVGNSLKYLSRAPFKHDSMKDDIAKAKKYLEFALERIERSEG